MVLRITHGARSAREQIQALRDEIEQRLQKSDDYRALIALDRALAEIGAGSAAAKGETAAESEGNEKGRLTQADAAYQVLVQERAPMPTGEIIKRLAPLGVTVGGKDPVTNLSSVLSKDTRFKVVKYQERSAWWIDGWPIPVSLSDAADLLKAISIGSAVPALSVS